MARRLLKRIPMWSRILTLVAATAGLAVVGSGITGDVSVKVQEPITFDSESGVSGDSQENAAVIYNDDTSMTVSAFTYPGDEYEIQLVLANASDVDQSQRLSIATPEGFRFSDVTGGTEEVLHGSPAHFGETIDVAALLEPGPSAYNFASDFLIGTTLVMVEPAEDLIDDNGDASITTADVAVSYTDADGGNTASVSSVDASIAGENRVEITITGDGFAAGDTLTITNGTETIDVAALLEPGPSAFNNETFFFFGITAVFVEPTVDLASASYTDADGTNALGDALAYLDLGRNSVEITITGDGYASGDTLTVAISGDTVDVAALAGSGGVLCSLPVWGSRRSVRIYGCRPNRR